MRERTSTRAPLRTAFCLSVMVALGLVAAGTAGAGAVTFGNGTTGVYKFCIVDQPLHAQTYIYDYDCEGDSSVVLDSMVSFLQIAMT